MQDSQIVCTLQTIIIIFSGLQGRLKRRAGFTLCFVVLNYLIMIQSFNQVTQPVATHASELSKDHLKKVLVFVCMFYSHTQNIMSCVLKSSQ